MNMIYLLALGLMIGSLLYLVEPQETKGNILGHTLLGVIGAAVGGMYAQVLFGVDFSQIGAAGVLLAVFCSILLLYLGKVVRKLG